MSSTDAALCRSLPDDAVGVVAAIVAGALAWSTTAHLVGAGYPVALLDQLADQELLDRWSLPCGCLWTLTSYSAAVAGVRLVTERGLLRWHGPGASEPPTRRPDGWDPWVSHTLRTSPRFVVDEIYDTDVVLWGERIPVDPRLGRRGYCRRNRARRAVALGHSA